MREQPGQRLRRFKDEFWWSFDGHGKKKRSPLSRKKTLGILKEFAAKRVYYQNRRPLSVSRRKFNKVKHHRHNVKFYRKCFACGGKAEVRHHVILLNHGGDNAKRNLVSLCRKCHAEIHPWLKEDSP